MKKNLISIVKNQPWQFNNLLVACLFILQGFQLIGQPVNEVLITEIELKPNTKIEITGPTVSVFGTGTMELNHDKEQYQVSGKNDPMLILNNLLDINTWDDSTVKVIHDVTLEVQKGVDVNEVLADLTPELSINAANILSLDFFSNLDAFEIDNGWFRDDNSKIKFKNGKSHRIKFLQISTSIYVPKSSILSLEGSYMNVNIGQHQGVLNLALESCVLNAIDLADVKANLSDCTVDINHINQGDLDFISCDVHIISAQKLSVQSCLSTLEIDEVKKLNIQKTLNDECKCNSVSQLLINEGLFSDFDFGSLEDEIEMSLLNSNVNISALGSHLKSFVMTNKNGELIIGTDKLKESILTLRNADLAKLSINNSFIEIEEDGNKRIFKLGKDQSESSIDISCELCTIKIK